MGGKTGKLLTKMQSFRLNMIAGVDRQRALEIVTEHLRVASRSTNSRHHNGGNAPRDWYARRGKS